MECRKHPVPSSTPSWERDTESFPPSDRVGLQAYPCLCAHLSECTDEYPKFKESPQLDSGSE